MIAEHKALLAQLASIRSETAKRKSEGDAAAKALTDTGTMTMLMKVYLRLLMYLFYASSPLDIITVGQRYPIICNA